MGKRLPELAGTLVRRLGRGLPGLAGAVLVSVGFGLAWLPLGLIAAGGFLLLLDWRIPADEAKSEPQPQQHPTFLRAVG